MNNMASLRIGKIDQGTETAAHNHNLRASQTKEEKNVNRNLSHKNQLLMGRADTVKAINEKIDCLDLKTAVRKDANRAIEFVLSASPEHFYDFEKAGITREDWDNITISNLGETEYWKRLAHIKQFSKLENIEAWKKNIVDFVNADPDLKNNLINLVVHDDEKSLHAHLLVVPVVQKKLTAKQFFTPGRARYWQDTYARATNLERGVPSEKKHDDKVVHLVNQAKKKGLKEGQKIGYKQGYKNGQEQGYKEAQKFGSKVGGMVTGFIGQLHSPTAKLIARTSEEIRKKTEEVNKQKALVESAKKKADSRVVTISNELQKVKKTVEELSKEVDIKDKTIEALQEKLQLYKKDFVNMKYKK